MTLFEVNFWNDLFSLPLEKWARIYPVWFDRACYDVCCMRVSICFSFRFFRHRWGGGASLLLMMIPLIDIVVVWFDTFVCTLIFETNNVILSPKPKYFWIGSIVFSKFWMFCGLSVNPISVRLIMYIKLVVCWCAAFPFPSRKCLWLSLRTSSWGGWGEAI